jgi:citrate lyase subunit beta/citryl-CoA lyase
MRSLLIVPPRDASAYAEALKSDADALVADAAVATGAGGPAHFLRAGLHGDLKAAAALRPRGLALASASGADVQRLGARLAVEEATLGLAEGTFRVLVFATESAEAVLGLASYRGASARLAGLVWTASPLDAALGAERRGGPFRLARDMTLLSARAAGVLAIDAPYPDVDDLGGLRAEALAARADGFDGKAALSAAQAAVINEVFTKRV